jgi:hypothetical protein
MGKGGHATVLLLDQGPRLLIQWLYTVSSLMVRGYEDESH